MVGFTFFEFPGYFIAAVDIYAYVAALWLGIEKSVLIVVKEKESLEHFG